MSTKLCPNKTFKSNPKQDKSDWDILVEAIGEVEALGFFNVAGKGKELPPIEEINSYIQWYKYNNDNTSQISLIVNEIEETVENSDIIETIDKFYETINSQLNKLKNTKSYKKLSNLFYKDNVNTLATLQDLLKQASLLEETAQNDHIQRRALVKAILYIKETSKLMLEDINSFISDKNAAIENISYLESYMKTVTEWEEILDFAKANLAKGNPRISNAISTAKGHITDIEKAIIQNDETGLTALLKDILEPAHNEINKQLEEKIDKLKQIKQKRIDRGENIEQINKIEEEIKSYENFKQKLDFSNGKTVLKYLKGEFEGNSIGSWFNMIFSSSISSDEPIIASFARLIQQQLHAADVDSYEDKIAMERELAPLVTSGERLDSSALGESLTFTDKIFKNGESSEEIVFLNMWKNYRHDLDKLKFEEQKAKEKYYEDSSKENKEEYKKCKKERQNFERDVMHQEYTKEYYAKFKLFEDEIGQELRRQLDEKYNQINQIDLNAKLSGDTFTEEELALKKQLQREITLLGSVNYADGTAKIGEDLKIAERFQEIKKINREIFVYKTSYTAYEKAKESYSNKLISSNILENSEEYEQKMKEWEKENTVQVISDSFYKYRQGLIDELNYLTSKLNAKNKDLNLSFEKLWETVTSLVYGMRDENNTPIGTLIKEIGAERIKNAQVEMEKLKDQLLRLSGLTKAEQLELNELFKKAKDRSISYEESERLEELNKKKKQTVKELGLNTERIYQIFEELSDLQSKIPTSYYVDVFNNLSSSIGVTINDFGEIIDEESGISIPVLESKYLDTLLEDTSFSNWFYLNHIQKEKYSPVTKSVEKVWERTYQWSKIIPNNLEHYETRPSNEYSYREVKNEERELAILKNKTDLTEKEKNRLKELLLAEREGKLVNYETKLIKGITVDNKGNFLPDPSKPKALEYINERFINLQKPTNEEEKRLKDIYDIHIKYHLKAQENSINKNKLWFTLPKIYKEGREDVKDFWTKLKEKPSSVPKELWEKVKIWYQSVIDRLQEDMSPKEQEAIKNRKDFVNVSMLYIRDIPADQTSLNITRSVLNYLSQANINKHLIATTPIANAFVRTSKTVTDSKNKRLIEQLNKKREFAIKSILTQEFENNRSNVEFKALGENAKPIIFIMNMLKKIGSIALIKLSIPNLLSNYANAEMQSFINSSNNLYQKKDYLVSLNVLHSRFLPALTRDNLVNTLGGYSLESQMYDLFEPIQGETLRKHIGNRFSNSNLLKIITLEPIFNLRENSEFYAQSKNFLAALNATKVELNGESISLLNAFELDKNGIIKLKEGIDKDWSPKGKKLLELKFKIQKMNTKAQGYYGEQFKSIADISGILSIFTYMKRFLPATATNMFGGTGLHKPTFNIDEGLSYGYLTQTLSILIKVFQGRMEILKDKGWENLTKQEKDSIIKTATFINTIILFKLFYMALGFVGDDKLKKKVLSKYDALTLRILYVVKKMDNELTAYFKPSAYSDFFFKPVVTSGLDKWLTTIEHFIAQEEYQTTTKSSKGNILHEAGDKKWKTDIKKAIGIENSDLLLENPDELLKNYEAQLNR